MQKKSFFLFLSSFVCVLLLWLVYSFGFLENDYADIQQKIKINSNFSWLFDTSITLSYPADSWIIAFPKSQNIDDVHVFFDIDGVSYERHIDQENIDSTEFFYTFPLVTQLRRDVHVRIETNGSHVQPELIAMNTQWYQNQSLWLMKEASASDNPMIVTRAQWGANESLRYHDQSWVDQKIQEWRERWKKPYMLTLQKSDQQKNQQEWEIWKIIQNKHPESFSIIAKIRYENWHKLIWPITRTKSVDRIIVHHTAESSQQAVENDITILRSIYMYHTVTRGWWDIWYNYIVGKDGTIYEWRSWWDYVEGAHAYANNLWTVWISVMWNFDAGILHDRQRQWLEDILVYVAKKYGINVVDETTWFRKCDIKKFPSCVIDIESVLRLHSHRDVGYTACPWEHLYEYMDDIRLSVSRKVWKVQIVYNKEKLHIEPIPEEDKIIYIPFEEKYTPSLSPKISAVSKTFWGKNIRVKLSYPNTESIILSNATESPLRIQIDNGNPFQHNYPINIWIVWNNILNVNIWWISYTGSRITLNGPIIRIDSWDRFPAWDATKKYNDNVFRSRIHVYNDWWKLLVVNDLPLEDYLRGIWEVSNTDNPEKIKTIIIAARTYARFYMLKTNRKYNTLLYDGSDDPNSFQKYLWYTYETRSPNVAREVYNTRWHVIVYRGKIIKPWYFSVSDWKTLSYKEYCEINTKSRCNDIPYLPSVVDPAWVWKVRNGHGVGISGIGSTYFAEQWWNHKQIIQYYLHGVEIMKK